MGDTRWVVPTGWGRWRWGVEVSRESSLLVKLSVPLFACLHRVAGFGGYRHDMDMQSMSTHVAVGASGLDIRWRIDITRFEVYVK